MRRLVLALLLAVVLAGCTGARDEASPEGAGSRILWDGGDALRIAPAGEEASSLVLLSDGEPVANVSRADWNASRAGGFRVPIPSLAPGAYEARVQAPDGRLLASRAFEVRIGEFASLAPGEGEARHAFRLTLEDERGTNEQLRLDLAGNLTAARSPAGVRLEVSGGGAAEGVQENYRFEGRIPVYVYEALNHAPREATLELEGIWETTGNAPPAEGTLRARTELLRLEACPSLDAVECRLTLDDLWLEGALEAGGAVAHVESHNVTRRWTVNATGSPVHAEWEEWTNRSAYGQTQRDHRAGETTWTEGDAPPEGVARFDAAFNLLGGWPALAAHPWPLQPGDHLEGRLGNVTWTWVVESAEDEDGIPTVRVVGAAPGTRALVHVPLEGDREGVATVVTLQEESGGARSRLTVALDALGAPVV